MPTRVSTPANLQFEQEIANDLSLYFDFTHSQGVHLTRFLNYGRLGFFAPNLGDVFVTAALGKSLYNGFTVGMRKRFSKGYQLEWNYVLSKDKDDDSNERDPFTDRSFDSTTFSLTMPCLIATSGTSLTSLRLPNCPGGLKVISACRPAQRNPLRRR